MLKQIRMVFCTLTPFTKKPERLPDCKTALCRHNQSRQRSLYMSALNSFPGGFIFRCLKRWLETSLIWCPRYVQLAFRFATFKFVFRQGAQIPTQTCSKTRDDDESFREVNCSFQGVRWWDLFSLCFFVEFLGRISVQILSWIANITREVQDVDRFIWVHEMFLTATVANWVFLSCVDILETIRKY